MPAVSDKQQEAMAIAEHAPNKLYKKNRGLLKLSHSQLHDFASTPRSNLPAEASPNPNPMNFGGGSSASSSSSPSPSKGGFAGIKKPAMKKF